MSSGSVLSQGIDPALVGLIAVAVPTGPFAVAVSGGSDSATLAVHAAHHAQQAGVVMHLFHVHHGLQAAADEWLHRVHDLGHQLRVACHSLRVSVDTDSGLGTEAAARQARYDALHTLADKAGIETILLGHHRDDQAETVLLRLLRGAGPQGLAAMAAQTQRDGLTYIRPWLTVPRSHIADLAAQYARATGWVPVQDPTNTDDRYTRSALRTRLAPVLNERWPAWRETVLRHASQNADNQAVLDEVARNDWAGLEPDALNESFSLARWRQLSAPRQALVLRYWLASHGLPMPSQARLRELMKQLQTVHALGHDRDVCVRHAGSEIRCRKGRIALERLGKT
jgi:tRNA(Ile)-lysidine synthase